jgi:putative hydrolase of the HAD superfamily
LGTSKTTLKRAEPAKQKSGVLMQEIKAVIFDAGNVILKGTTRHFYAAVWKRLCFKPAIKKAGRIPLYKQMDSGKTSPKQMLEKIYPKASKKQMREILLLWKKAWPTDKAMVALVKKLRKQHIVSMISNSDPAHEKRMRKEGVLALFEKPVLSHRVGLIKPDKKIFVLALKRLGLKAQECVFIDDTKRNTAAAKKLGFKVINFKNRQQCERELKKALLHYGKKA